MGKHFNVTSADRSADNNTRSQPAGTSGRVAGGPGVPIGSALMLHYTNIARLRCSALRRSLLQIQNLLTTSWVAVRSASTTPIRPLWRPIVARTGVVHGDFACFPFFVRSPKCGT